VYVIQFACGEGRWEQAPSVQRLTVCVERALWGALEL